MDETGFKKCLSASFATLLRSHSASLTFRRRSYQKPDITKQSFFEGYADMTTEQERPSRKESRLYKFLSRSRSRSRSAAEPAVTSPKPRHPPDNTGSKPPSRLQSRPLSSTTTSTTTVTPGTPKPSRKSHRPSNPNSPLTPRPTPRPTTPVNRPSSARQKLQDFFTGRKSSTSRSRSRSRPSSPLLNDNPPPLPSADDDTTPRPKRSSPPSRHTTPSPTPKVLRVTNATTTSSSTGSTAASIKISKFFSKEPSPPTKVPSPPTLPPLPISRVSSLYRRSTHNTKEPLAITTPTPPSPSLPPPKIMHTPPTPLKSPRDSSSNINNASGSGSSSSHSHSQLPVPSRPIYHAAKGSLDSSYRYRGNAAMGVVNEESPLVNNTSNNHHRKGKARDDLPSSSTNLHLLHTRPSLKMSSAARATKHGSFDFERPGWGSVTAGALPSGDGPVKMKRTGSNGTTGTGASDRTSELREKERESTYGPGLAGVGTLQRDVSMKRAQEREEIMIRRKRKEEEASSGNQRRNGKEKEKEDKTSSQRTTPSASDHMHASTSTAGTKHSSSAGKAAGKRMLHSALGANNNNEKERTKPSGISRLMAPAHHGLFSFEPPVPSPTRSTGTASTGTAHEVTLTSGYGVKAERERERIRDEKERSSRIPGVGTRRSGDRAPVPVPSVAALYGITPADMSSSPNSTSPPPYDGMSKIPNSNIPGPGHRSGKKGRSLDLGLGLSWAPSKVREEALMNLPKSAFFGRRTSSGGSSIPGGGYGGGGGGKGNGNAHNMLRTASESTTRSNATGGGRVAEDVERSKLGKEVAQFFKNALDAEGYKAFKLYVHQFDRHEIPFDGPEGIVSLVEGLLLAAPRLGEDGRRRLLDKFVRIILQQA